MGIVQGLMMSYGGGKSFPKTGLVSYYKLDNNANDSHGSNDGTVTGATYTASGKINGAYTFGVSKYIQANNTITGNVITMSFRMKTSDSSTPVNGSMIVGIGNSATASSFSKNVFIQNGKLYIYNTEQNVAYNPIGPATGTYNDGSWHFVIAEINGTSYKLYVDNSLVLNTTGGSQNSSANKTNIGAFTSSTGTFIQNYVGEVDEVGLRNTTLTTDEKTNLYNGGSGLPYS